MGPIEICVCRRAGRYEVDGYVYSAAEEPKVLMTGKWNESLSYQLCDVEGEPLPGTELKEVILVDFALVISNYLYIKWPLDIVLMVG